MSSDAGTGKEAAALDRNIEAARRIARLVGEKGGAVYYVGGFVRDRLRGVENKDVDIEVHGIRPAELEAVLDTLGERIAIGESFGVYALKGLSLDIAMPRREENRGHGHRDFAVSVDPFLGTYKAAVRRDFTVNAMREDVLTGELTDPFGGARDLERGVLRHVSDRSFPEDPLRVLRAAQFAARFGFTVAPETEALCARMDLSALARERVMGETEKALLKADKPSVFFETLRRMGQLSVWYPELEKTIAVEQPPMYHAEGDVWTHTMMVLDEAAALREKTDAPLALMLAALTHDFGKALCTERIDGKIHAYGHETAGLPPARAFLERLTGEKALTKLVLNLTELHMKPNILAAAGAPVKSTNRLFDQATDPQALLCLAAADGRGKLPREDCGVYEAFLRERLEIYREYMSRPYVTGQDLIDAGVAPSKRFSDYLAFAHRLRLAGVDRRSALQQTLGMARKAGDLRD